MNTKHKLMAVIYLTLIMWFLPAGAYAQAIVPSSAPEMPAGKSISIKPKAFKDLQVIDHWNLRYHKEYEEFSLQEQVGQIKRNMDVTAQLGFTSYLLFQKDAFPKLLTWRGRHAPDQELRAAVQEVLDHAMARGLKLYLHCNEFMWPDSVDVEYGDASQAWRTYRDALQELIALYPDLAGFEVTADETGGALEEKEGVLQFHNETARALCSDGRQRFALMRTWQRVDALGSPTTLGKTDAPNVLFSVKNTDGDFGAVKDLDQEFLEAVDDPKRLLVEFDAWREYETHNIFPIYLGDYWAPRFRELARLGVERIGVRFNWNSGHFAITERPWANWVNVFTFVRLAEHAHADPDEILREYVALYYPPQARTAAFDLYKSSFQFARDLYWHDREKIADHGRVNRERKIGDRSVPADWFTRVDRLTEQMLSRIDALPDSGAHKQELRKGALVVSYLSKACGLQLGAEGDTEFLDRWKDMDPLSFDKLRAEKALDWVRKRQKTAKIAAAEPKAVVRGDSEACEAEAAQLIGAMVVRPETEDLEFHEGATGDAFVDFQKDSGEAIIWTVELPAGGPHQLWLRYALEEYPRAMKLMVNDQVVEENLVFVSTGDWERWRSIKATTVLREGRNVIRLEATGDSGPNIDHLRIEEGQELPADDKQSVVPVVPGKTVVRDGTRIEFYPKSSISRSDGRISGIANGEPLGFEYFRTSREYYYDVSYAWFAADGPIEIDLKIDAPIGNARLRTVLKDIPFRRSGSNLAFTLPGPGHYYLQVPDLGQPEPGNPDSGTYTILFIIDDLTVLKANRPDPNAANIKDVTQHGVISNPTKDQTDAMQYLIAQGGDIYIPPGIYRVRTLKIPSNTNIYLAPGAVIKAPDGISVDKGAPFLNLKHAHNIRIYGPGSIDGNGYEYHLVQTENSSDITIEDALFRNCGSWAIHLLLVDQAICHNVRILSGKDGIDPDCAKDVLIQNCLIMSKDDSIAVKTCKPPAATERITICNCIVASDGSALKIGTETRALMRDIRFENWDVFDSDRGIIMYARDGGPIENVTWRNIRMSMTDWPHETGGAPLEFFITKRGGLTAVGNCLVENIVASAVAPSGFAGLADAPLDGLRLRNITLNVRPPRDSTSGPYLFSVNEHVDVRVDDLVVNWQGHREQWGGLCRAKGLKINRLVEFE